MIGHYLNNLTPAQEDRVLTARLAKAQHYQRDDGCRCLVGVAADVHGFVYDHEAMMRGSWKSRRPELRGANVQIVGWFFDRLCERFGESRVNAAIRNRILSNRARRELRGVRDSSGVAAETP